MTCRYYALLFLIFLACACPVSCCGPTDDGGAPDSETWGPRGGLVMGPVAGRPPESARCMRCGATYWRDSFTWCPTCDVDTSGGPGTLAGAPGRVLEMRNAQQARLQALADSFRIRETSALEDRTVPADSGAKE